MPIVCLLIVLVKKNKKYGKILKYPFAYLKKDKKSGGIK